jgi:hypothetical protein
VSDARPRSTGGGRDVISARAIEKVVRAVTAEQFDVPVRTVSADLQDEAGRLDLAIRTAIRVVPLARVESDPGVVERTGGTVLERAAEGEQVIIDRVGAITGSAVAKVALRFTRAEIRQERRVR